MLRPQVLLLDEPLGALDLKLRKAMQLELKTLQTQVGITFIYVTHYQEEALTMSDYIAVMNAGKILQLGHATEIYEEPATKFVADFIGESNFIEGRVISIDPQTICVESDNLEFRAAARKDVSMKQKVIVAIRPERVSLVQDRFEGVVNQYSGKIEALVFSGSTTMYQVRLNENVLLSVREANVARANAASDLRIGDQVWAHWEPTAAVFDYIKICSSKKCLKQFVGDVSASPILLFDVVTNGASSVYRSALFH